MLRYCFRPLEYSLSYYNRARTRELPDNYPFIVHSWYISAFTKKWRQPALDLFHAVHLVLSGQIKVIVADHFGQFGSLQNKVQ